MRPSRGRTPAREPSARRTPGASSSAVFPVLCPSPFTSFLWGANTLDPEAVVAAACAARRLRQRSHVPRMPRTEAEKAAAGEARRQAMLSADLGEFMSVDAPSPSNVPMGDRSFRQIWVHL